MKRIISTMLCLTLMNSTTQLLASAEQTPFNLTSEEQLLLDEMLDTLGYDSIDDLLRTRVAMPTVDRIKDLNRDNDISVVDAQIIFLHLAGNYLYNYSYKDLDVTADSIIDADDASAYLRYVAYYIADGSEAPYSPSFGTKPVVTQGVYANNQIADNYDTRSYIKYDYSTEQSYVYELKLNRAEDDPFTLTPYTLPNASSASMVNDSQLNTASTTSSDDVWIPTNDTRIVRTGEINEGNTTHQATGFIVGEHVIATAAHCLYNTSSAQFNPYRAVWAYTYTEVNGETVATPHQLTVTSVHVPEYYVTSTTNAAVGQTDYGLIVVEEDLTSYGFFNLGMLTSDAPCSTGSTAEDAVPLTITQYRTLNSGQAASYLNKTPTYRNGWLSVLTDYRLAVLPNNGGVSGSPVFATNSNDTVVGIVNSTGSGGLAMTRPLLQFYLNNEAF